MPSREKGAAGREDSSIRTIREVEAAGKTGATCQRERGGRPRKNKNRNSL